VLKIGCKGTKIFTRNAFFRGESLLKIARFDYGGILCFQQTPAGSVPEDQSDGERSGLQNWNRWLILFLSVQIPVKHLFMGAL
jgi:hypothetical protein